MRLSKLAASALTLVVMATVSTSALAERTGNQGYSVSPSTASAIGVSAVPVLSVWLLSEIGKDSVKGISKASTISKTAEEQPNWKVTALAAENGGVRAQFTSTDNARVIEVVLPQGVANDAKLALGDNLQLRKVGKSSAVLNRGTTPVVVLTDPGSNLMHSSRK